MYQHSQLFQNKHIASDTNANHKIKTTLPSFIDEIIPHTIKSNSLSIQKSVSETNYLTHLKSYKNKDFQSYIGFGYHPTICPAVIQRCIFENPNWYTQYTPYQAEISQGRLEALINFQTMITELTKLPIANASLLDEATAAAEAMVMLFRSRKQSKSQCNTFLVSNSIFPQTLAVLATRAKYLNIQLELIDTTKAITFENAFGMIIQTPDKFGQIQTPERLIQTAKKQQCPTILITDIMSLILLKAPGDYEADIAVGSTQRFGIPMGYGGPHAAFIATTKELSRKLPGRIIGATIDKHGNKAYRMALQTREQHIRKEKATSNICTAQALLAMLAGMYAVYHGPETLKQIAKTIHNNALILAQNIKNLGLTLKHDTFFDTLCIVPPNQSFISQLKTICEDNDINLNYLNKNYIQISISETTTQSYLELLVHCIQKALNKNEKFTTDHFQQPSSIEFRNDTFLTQDCFNKYRTETDIMRYIKHLEDKDYSLTTGMIPLGSCTMKLNAATEMLPLSWSNFSNIHPFAPADQTNGYKKMITELEAYLCDITGFKKVSFQPNSGAQGEYAGLITIKEYQKSIQQDHRNIALIPTSAHGTNPASAILAGLDIVPIKCLENGYIDEKDLDEKINKYKEFISVLMITYPSTYGIFEENVQSICEKIHAIGGQVYMDGANMNAQVGLTNPSIIGADVCHLNLHKTFAIPHGGGGPGMGPICVANHLIDSLPNFDLSQPLTSNAIASAEYSSASILLISFAYIKLLGGKGLRDCTVKAIENANYIKSKLDPYFDVLFTNNNGYVAHELIVDCRPFKKSANIDVEDIAKRLIDYSFHAPTMSWPVAGSLMIEPTESESVEEMNRFCNAMISIKKEIDDIVDGKSNTINNVLKNAPHTIQDVSSDNWNYPYSRQQAAYPLESLRTKKFWPSVGRLNQALGDRQLICTCDTSHLLNS